MKPLIAFAFVFVLFPLSTTACGSAADEPPSDPADFGSDDAVLSVSEADDCTARAWTCALDAAAAMMQPTQDDVRGLLASCLADAKTADGDSCETACRNASADQQPPQAEHCDRIVAEISKLADKEESCRTELIECLGECLERGEDPSEGDPMRPFAQCWTFGLTSDCPLYVRDLAGCGGSLDPASNDACLSRCEATFGAWSSDLDELCENQCQTER